VPMKGSVSGEVFATGRARLLDGLAARTVAGNMQVATGADIGPVMVVPLLGEHGPRGTLVLNRLQGREVFEAGDLKLATAFANQAAVALELADARERAQQFELLQDRDRIARDLHDHVIQRLFAAGLTLQSLAGAVGAGPHAERLDRAIEDIDETITQIRSAIYGLRTPLGPAMSSGRDRILEVLADVSPLLPAEPAVQFSGPLDVMVPDEVFDDVVAVLREALTNVARHAQARRIEVVVIALAATSELLVQVSDDGVGLGPDGRRSGLANLRERAENRAGTFTVESPVPGSDSGTRLRWVVPL
jgi:signal transduction histidine kinase